MHFSRVTLPLARRGLIAAFILSWAKALGEFGATIMVAGTMAMRTETLPIAIYMRLASADIEGTVALILVLVAPGLRRCRCPADCSGRPHMLDVESLTVAAGDFRLRAVT